MVDKVNTGLKKYCQLRIVHLVPALIVPYTMGSTVVQHRAAIGTFAAVHMKILTRKVKLFNNGRVPRLYAMCGIHTRLTVLNLIITLLLIGGVESNPGPDPSEGVSTRASSGAKGGEKQMKLSVQPSDKTIQSVLDEIRGIGVKVDNIQRSNEAMNRKLCPMLRPL